MGCVNEKPKKAQKPLNQNPSKTTNNASIPPTVNNGNAIPSTISNPAKTNQNTNLLLNKPTTNPQHVQQANKNNMYDNKSASKLSDKQAVSYDASAQKKLAQYTNNAAYQSDLKRLSAINQTSLQKQDDSGNKSVNNKHVSYMSASYQSNVKGQQNNTNNYKSIYKDDANVPQDSVMDFGQTTIEDLNKVQVNFHV